MTKVMLALSVTVLLLTGCASTQTQHSAGAGQPTSDRSTAPATTMPMATTSSTSDAPSATAKMVCGDDIRTKVAQVLKLPAPPKTGTSWTDQRYTCTYRLPMGPMVLSVKQSAGKAAAAGYFASLRSTLGNTETLQGLGERSYGTGTGVVVVIKDDLTLTVDTTSLPTVFGPDGQRRADLVAG